jgi:hypothetical protein
VPWSQRSEMSRLLGHIDGFKVRDGWVWVLGGRGGRGVSWPGWQLSDAA